MARNTITETIDTLRLQLVPMALGDAAAMVGGHHPADARWADGYPTEASLVSAGLVVTAEAEGRPLGHWTTYQMVRRSDGYVIGDCSFLGAPDRYGHVHVAFSVADSNRGEGYATEALGAMIEWAKRQPGVTRVLADTACTNLESIAIMEGAGMRRAGSDGQLVFYES